MSYQKLQSQRRCIHQNISMVWAILIFLSAATDGRQLVNVSAELNLKGYSSKSNGGEERNSSSCLLSYSNMDSGELSKLRDASGKVGSGIYGGNNVWFGSFSECKKIKESRYCLVFFDAILYLDKERIEISQLEYGVCAPKLCTKYNIDNDLGYILKNISMIQVKPDPKKLSKNIYCAEEDQEYTTGVVLTIVLCGFFIFLGLLATILEPINNFYNEKDKSTMQNSDEFSMDKTSNEKTPLLHGNGKPETPKIGNSQTVTAYKLLNCFSLIKNTSFILNTNVGKSDLTYLHGIRVLSLFWIILLHHTGTIIAMPGSSVPGKVIENDNDALNFYRRMSMMAPNQALAVDTFFLLSGLLVMYVNLKKMEKNNGNINWIKFYFHRFWRLTPSYMFAILFLTKLQPFFGDGPLWFIMRKETSACSDYWWTNLLYINNFHPSYVMEACIPQTWYLSADMQFFIISPILIIIVLRFGFKPFLTFASVLILASMVTIAGLVGDEDLSPVSSFDGKKLRNDNDYGKHVYSKPYCRIQPYLVGMVLGYMIFKNFGRKIRLRWYLAVLLWCVAVLTTLAIMYAPHNAIKDNPHEWSKGENVVYASVRWFLYSLSVGWVIFACENGYAGLVKDMLSAKFWIPLSRINYAAYILHFAVTKAIIYNIETPIHFDTFAYVNYFLSSLVLTYACAFIFAVVVELPFANLEFLMLKK